MLVEELQSVLTTDPGMVALLGTPQARPDSTNGVFPVQAPDQPTMPYLVLMQVSGAPLQTSMAGTGALTRERWRFSCHGTTYKRAKKFAKDVRDFLISLLGMMPGGTAFIQGAWIKLEADDQESLGKGTLYKVHLDVEFEYLDLDNEADV